MKITYRDRPVVFVDLEASGLDAASYPIEIGWSADDEREPGSFLIRPAADWARESFSDAALGVHNIPYDALLAEGVAVAEACERLTAAWTGAILISDNPASDGKWLARLYKADGLSCPWRLVDFDVVTTALAQQAGLTLADYADALNRAHWSWPIPHRAGPDARRLHRIARAMTDPDFRTKLPPR
jgi:hypothetical protein